MIFYPECEMPDAKTYRKTSRRVSLWLHENVINGVKTFRNAPLHDAFINSVEAGKILEVSQYTLRQWVDEGILPRTKDKKFRHSAVLRLKLHPEVEGT